MLSDVASSEDEVDATMDTPTLTNIPHAAPRPFVAVVVMESSSSSPDYEPLCREDMLYFVGASETEVRAKIDLWAPAEAKPYANEAGETISWKLRHIVDVCEFDLPARDGDSLYSRHFRDLSAYEHFEPLLRGKKL
jgi:hypothetical protein